MRLALAVLLAVVAGCSSTQPRTEVVVRILADPAVVAATARLHVVVRAGANRAEDSLALRAERDLPDTGALVFPYELALVPADGDATRVFEVTVTAQRGDHSYVGSARVISGYVTGQTLSVPLRLEDACLGVPECTPGNTCHLAMCVDAYVDPATLSIFEFDDAGAPDTGGASPCVLDPTLCLDAGPDAGGGMDANVDADIDGGPDVGTDAFRPIDATLDTTLDGGGGLPPQLRRPMSGMTVLGSQPVLEYFGTPTGVMIDVCEDRECATPIESIAALGGQGTPSAPLRAGPIFWRVRDGALTSHTWEFFVAPSTSHATASFGMVFDPNGDGHADLAVGAPSSNRAYLFLSNGSTIDTASPTLLSGSAQFGAVVASAGDRDGNGYVDFAVGAPGARRATVYRGTPTGIDTSSTYVFPGGDATSRFGASISSGGDFDDDGHAELVIGGPGQASFDGLVSISSDVVGTPGAVNGGMGTGFQFGFSVVGGFDMNADHHDDVFVITAAGSGTTRGTLYYIPGASPLPAMPVVADTVFFSSASATASVHGVTCLGDVNGDGNIDLGLAITDTAGASRVNVMQGNLHGLPPAVVSALTSSDPGFANAVARGCDLNGDGFSDVAVGAEGLDATIGHVYVYDGSGSGVAMTASIVLDAPAGVGEHFGAAVACLGDVNGDTFSDLAVGAPRSAGGAGAVYVYLGGAGGVGSSPDQTIAAPSGAMGFGASVE